MMTDDEQKRIFSRNLNRLLSENDKTQKEVADAIGVSPQTFNTWCQGIALPRMGKVQKLADYFHVGKTDLIDEKTATTKKTMAVQVPVLGRVAAGYPLTAVENVIDMEEISADMVGDFVGLQIHGDSMEPRMRDGDVVIVRRQPDADSGDTVIAMINGDEATCKKLIKHQDGITLVSTNTKYDPMYFSNREIQEKPITIFGKVVELRAKF